MGLSDLINKFFKNTDRSLTFNFIPDEIDGAYFSLDKKEFEKVKGGTANEWLIQQYVTLKMLEEQGEAESIPNGFIVSSSVICRLDDYERESLSLPPRWDGVIYSDIRGNSGKSNFSVELAVSDPDGRITHSYTCLLYTSPSPRDRQKSRMPSSA